MRVESSSSGTPVPSPEPAQQASPEPADVPREPTPSTQLSSHPVANEDFFGAEELVEELKTGLGTRNEGWFLAQITVFALMILQPFKLQGLVDMAGSLMLAAGAVFIAYALMSLGRNLSPMPAPRKQHKLVTDGMYAWVRHPMYGGVLLFSVGLAAVTRSETRLLLAIVLWWILEQKADLEEAALTELYPEEYPAYKKRVKKFVPYLGP